MLAHFARRPVCPVAPLGRLGLRHDWRPWTRAHYAEIADDLVAQNADISLGQMMGMPCIKRGTKMIGGFWQGAMVFKLPDPDQHAQALSLEGAHLFDPGGRAAR